MGQNIFNIAEEYLSLCNEIEEAEGELTPELNERLTINQEELERKIKAYFHIIQTKDSESKLIDDEISRLLELKKSKENVIEKLNERMLFAVNIFGETGKSGNKTLKYDTCSFWTVKHKPLVIEDEETFTNPNFTRYQINEKLTLEDRNKLVEEGYITKDTPKVILKTELKNAIKEGQKIEGAYIDEKACYLRKK
jgi:hypothetical protein